MTMLTDLKKAKRGAIAKAISIMENDPKEARQLIKKIYKVSGNAIVIGITGPAGAGKSSIINKLSIEMKKLKLNPAVLAVDPTSHITGGAILGDRVRMSESTDTGTYIRSIASRGATGAIAHSVRNSLRVLEYAGFNPIIIESVGAGQTEVDISKIADITVVTFNPHTGDSIQTIKAGITEIGDIYLVNKSDLDGATQLFQALQDFIGTAEKEVIILKTSVNKNKGIKELAGKLKELMKQKIKDKKSSEKSRIESELEDIILNNVRQEISTMIHKSKSFSSYLKKIQDKKMDPFEAADKLTKNFIK
ncbi:MAG: methylmalonyl Co-A mutase-associated GTPase MeaB [Crenarchaeota archaeon]|nr:methylmalonyl Co-A mutase-associated GTPase MeaB [Thermoproteota archaeon]MDA1124591.1 methylmalonyl Co-A mutase-associated GTPase MeaB [Thermoproteota archaeon]